MGSFPFGKCQLSGVPAVPREPDSLSGATQLWSYLRVCLRSAAMVTAATSREGAAIGPGRLRNLRTAGITHCPDGVRGSCSLRTRKLLPRLRRLGAPDP